MSIEQKIVQGLERISDVFKTLLLDQAKEYGISPIQIQIVFFIHSHPKELCGVTQLAKEYNLTKPTVSDAVKSLHAKGYVEKDYSSEDSRSYTLFLTSQGKELVAALADYAEPIERVFKGGKTLPLESFYSTLTQLIFQLNQQGVIQVQRTCFGCRFYSVKEAGHHCGYIHQSLSDSEIRLDCNEFEPKRS